MKPIQFLLILVLFFIVYMLRGYNKYVGKALSRVGLLLLVIFLLLAILFPSLLQEIAVSLGVGRGTDLIVYISACSIVALSILILIEAAKTQTLLCVVVREAALHEANSRIHGKS